MATFNSEKVDIARSNDYVFEFLSDFRNFEKLMPEQVTGWTTDGDSCSFTIQNLATLGMRYNTRTPHSHIGIVSEGKVPFEYDLQCNIQETEPGACSVVLQFNADINPMLMMMVSKPLGNLVNILGRKLKEICEQPA